MCVLILKEAFIVGIHVTFSKGIWCWSYIPIVPSLYSPLFLLYLNNIIPLLIFPSPHSMYLSFKDSPHIALLVS